MAKEEQMTLGLCGLQILPQQNTVMTATLNSSSASVTSSQPQQSRHATHKSQVLVRNRAELCKWGFVSLPKEIALSLLGSCRSFNAHVHNSHKLGDSHLLC